MQKKTGRYEGLLLVHDNTFAKQKIPLLQKNRVFFVFLIGCIHNIKDDAGPRTYKISRQFIGRMSS